MKYPQVLFSPFTGNRTYTYHTELEVKEGNYAVVKTPSSKYQVVKVVGFMEEKPSFETKPILQLVEDSL